MKKRMVWGSIIALAGIGVFCILTFFAYTPAKGLYNFPVPVAAELTDDNEMAQLYDWNQASEEKGIPFTYEMMLKVHGWEKGPRQGASVVYSKGDTKIDLIASTNRLILINLN